jgi:UDP-glucose:(heptosyl)LPS alpha-1,3-glucosyltransferase
MVRREIHARFGVPLERLHLVRNGVDLERFRPPTAAERAAAREGLGLGAGRTVFAYVGSGFARKGLAAAIRALPMSARGDAVPVLLVAGADRHARRYRDLAARLGVGAQVRFLGGVDDVRPVLWAADGFVLPTLYDPFPNAVLEALAAGLPSITSTKSGAAEFIRDGENGYVVDALDVAGLARAMQALADPQGREARAAAARASVESLSLDSLARQLIGLYRRLLESSAP